MEDHIEAGWAFIREHSADIAAVIGSVSSALCTFSSVKSTRAEAALSAMMGIPSAIYSGPVLYAILPQLGANLSGYLMGFFGFNICKAALKAWCRFGDDADFWSLVKELVLRLYDRYFPPRQPQTESEKE